MVKKTMKKDWWEINAEKLIYIFIINMVIIPIIIWLLLGSAWARAYLLVIGIGIPYIITTAGQLIWYKKAPEAKEYVEKKRKSLDRAKGLKNVTHDFEFREFEEAKKEHEKAKSLDDFFFRSSGILKMFTLLGAIMFFLSDSLDGISRTILNFGNESVETRQKDKEENCCCSDSLLLLSNQIKSLELAIDSLDSKEFKKSKKVEPCVIKEGPKTKY